MFSRPLSIPTLSAAPIQLSKASRLLFPFISLRIEINSPISSDENSFSVFIFKNLETDFFKNGTCVAGLASNKIDKISASNK